MAAGDRHLIHYPTQRQRVFAIKFPEELFEQLHDKPARVRFAKGNDAIIVGDQEYPLSRQKEHRRNDVFRGSGKRLEVVGTVKESLNISFVLGSNRISKISQENAALAKANQAKQAEARVLGGQEARKRSTVATLRQAGTSSLSTAASSALHATSPAQLQRESHRNLAELSKLATINLPSQLTPNTKGNGVQEAGTVVFKGLKPSTVSMIKKPAGTKAPGHTQKTTPATPAKGTNKTVSTPSSSKSNSTSVSPISSSTSLNQPTPPGPTPSVPTPTLKRPLAAAAPDATVKLKPENKRNKVSDKDETRDATQTILPEIPPASSVGPVKSHSAYKQYCSIYNDQFQVYRRVISEMDGNRDKFLKLEEQLQRAVGTSDESRLKKLVNDEYQRAGGDRLHRQYDALHAYLSALKRAIHDYVDRAGPSSRVESGVAET